MGQDLSVSSKEEKPMSVLRLGLSTYDKYGQDLALELNYEYFITPRLGVKAGLFHNLGLRNSPNLEGRVFNLGGLTSVVDINQIANISFALNYYFRKNSQAEHFLSLRIMDALAITDSSQYTFNPVSNTLGVIVDSNDKNEFEFGPDIGFYYGYRKEFKSGLFLEGRIGIYYGNKTPDEYLPHNGFALDAQLTVGWTIPFTKKK